MRTIMVGALCAIAMVANANAAIKEEPSPTRTARPP